MIPREIQINEDYTFTIKKYVKALQIIPISGTITIYNNSGASVSTGAVTIAADGTMTYTFAEADNDTLDNNFKLELEYLYNSTTYKETYLFDVVNYPLVNIVVDFDLYKWIPELRRKLYECSGQTDSTGTTTTIIDDQLKVDDRDFTGGRVQISVTDSSIHEARIDAFDFSTGTITFNPAYTSSVGADIFYVVRESYESVIDTAFNDYVIKDIRDKVKRAAGYINSNITKNLTVFKALEIICFSSFKIEQDKWYLKWEKFKEMYSMELEKLNESYDTDEDGNISDQEDAERPNFSNGRIIR